MESISGFGLVLLFIIGGVGFIVMTLLLGRLLRPSNPSEEKLSGYESGEVAIQSAWKKFDVRFYIIALIFLLFEAELVFLFPWATVFGNDKLMGESDGLWAYFSLIETLIFIGILAVGLAYVWRKGLLDWIKPEPKPHSFQGKVPRSVYQAFNEKY